MRSTKKTNRPPRGTITRESLADAALAIADRLGVEAVTLRALAAAVGVASPMALYTYVASKDDLVTAMRERVVGRIRQPRTSLTTWQALLEETAHGLARTAREHPNWIPLVFHGSKQPSSFLSYADRLIELMLKDGFTVADALTAHTCVLSFTLGSVSLRRSLTASAGDDPLTNRLSLLQHVVAQAPAGRYASLASVAAEIDRYRFDDTFQFGLRSLLAGIEAQRRPARVRAIGRHSTPRRRRRPQT